MKFKQTMYLHHTLDSNRNSVFTPYASDMSKYPWCGAVIATQEVEFDISIPPGFDGVAAEVERLKAEQTKLRAEFQRALDENMARINSLLAIEHKEIA